MDKFLVLSFLLRFGHSWGYRSSQCGTPLNNGKIIGGVDSGGYQYPWFALLLLKKNSYLPIPVCAGSLITPYHVLTAAHCFTINPSIENKDLYTVALGVYDICDGRESTRELFDVAEVSIHEKYEKREKFYDIAVIRLASPSIHVTICLPDLGVPDLTEIALIIGFGATKKNSSLTPCHMMEVNVTKYSKKDCAKTKLPLEDKNEQSVICAGALDGKVDSCYGDSGGPLQTKTPDGRYVLAGIVSYGYGCATPELPGIYTNVGYYMDWINDRTREGAQSGGKNMSGTYFTGQRPRTRRPTVIFPEKIHSKNSSESVRIYFTGKGNERKDGNNFRGERSKNTAKRPNTRVIFPN